ncbi:MAG: hypothetical protein IJP91_02955 [Synergistaceae bacterium]|nr:hypothetical protein [Synergistaceae bacterium]
MNMNNDVIGLFVESWRFSKVFRDIMPKLSEEDSVRFSGRYSWFCRRLEEIASNLGLKIIEITPGTVYDVGMAVAPVNIDDFNIGDSLCVVNMIEPIIMSGDTVIKNGTVILERAEDL